MNGERVQGTHADVVGWPPAERSLSTGSMRPRLCRQEQSVLTGGVIEPSPSVKPLGGLPDDSTPWPHWQTRTQ